LIATTTEQKLLTSALGYGYVNQLYMRKSVGETIRESSSRICEKKWSVENHSNE